MNLRPRLHRSGKALFVATPRDEKKQYYQAFFVNMAAGCGKIQLLHLVKREEEYKIRNRGSDDM